MRHLLCNSAFLVHITGMDKTDVVFHLQSSCTKEIKWTTYTAPLTKYFKWNTSIENTPNSMQLLYEYVTLLSSWVIYVLYIFLRSLMHLPKLESTQLFELISIKVLVFNLRSLLLLLELLWLWNTESLLYSRSIYCMTFVKYYV